MKISKHNYEIYFIDYYDGNLSAEQSAELFLFLESHPEFKEEFDNFSNIQLDTPELQFPDRDSLKKAEVIIVNMDEQLVAAMEGDLSLDERQKLESHLQSNPKLRKEAELFKATISVPDLSVIYPDKKSLKKPIPFFIAYKNEFRYGIAALFLLAMIAGTVTVFNRTMENPAVQVAEKTPVKAHDYNSVPDSMVSHSSNHANPEIANASPSVTPEKLITGISNRSMAHQKVINREVLPRTEPGQQMQIAAMIPVKTIQSETINMEVASNAAHRYIPASSSEVASPENYMTVWEALRETSEKNLRKAVGKDDEALAYAEEPENSRVRLVDVVSKGIEKISNDKAKLESTYDSDTQSNAFSFSVGNFKIEKK